MPEPVASSPGLPSGGTPAAGAAGPLRPDRWPAWAGVLLAPSAAVVRRWALAGVVVSALIILTGAAVRLSQSGLGCPDWPACTANSVAASGATGDTLIHRWIEFGNRLVTVAIFVVAIGVFIAGCRFRPPGGGRRRDVIWLAAAQPVAIVIQAGLGGLVVRTKLNPALVSVHFLASVALVAATVGLYIRCQESTGQPAPFVPRTVRLAAIGIVGTIALMMAAGTVVTGTGPLAGAADVPRYHLPLEGVTQLHADIGWLLAGLMVALLLGLRLTAAPAKAVRLGWLLLGLIGLQGVIGYTQYFTGLPAGLVWCHVAGSLAIWITALLLPYALRDRGSVTAPDALRPHAAPQATTAPAEAG
ncbi:MAG TPA: COX15/CtaA family protein [Streptosporangiaceae bacterium]|nr:COX15/CtaA family protein [Streptosporangiaceae bacterium]